MRDEFRVYNFKLAHWPKAFTSIISEQNRNTHDKIIPEIHPIHAYGFRPRSRRLREVRLPIQFNSRLR